MLVLYIFSSSFRLQNAYREWCELRLALSTDVNITLAHIYHTWFRIIFDAPITSNHVYKVYKHTFPRVEGKKEPYFAVSYGRAPSGIVETTVVLSKYQYRCCLLGRSAQNGNDVMDFVLCVAYIFLLMVCSFILLCGINNMRSQSSMGSESI